LNLGAAKAPAHKTLIGYLGFSWWWR